MEQNSCPAGFRPVEEKENKELLLAMLQNVHDFCEANHIRYYLYFGTLLGAVRHNGFIPWDDDVDICMTRTEYEKFIRIFPRNKDGRYRVLIPGDKDCYVPYAKIIDNNTVLYENNHPPIGLYVDLFIIDNEADTFRGAQLFLRMVSSILLLRKCGFDNPNVHNKWKLGLFRIAHPIIKIFSDEKRLCFVDKVSRMHRSRKNCKYVGAVNAGAHYNERQILQGEWFKDTVLLDFEGRKFHAPANWDEVLKTIYVNYMDFPSEESRKPHHSDRKYIKVEHKNALIID